MTGGSAFRRGRSHRGRARIDRPGGSRIDRQRLLSTLEGLAFYHTIPLTPALSTPGWPVVIPIAQRTQRALGKLELRGGLDVGGRDGLFWIDAEKLGASEVTGFDYDLTPGVTDFFNSRARIQSLNLFA